jgi:uncharacterized small protein (DUF1192 family)
MTTELNRLQEQHREEMERADKLEEKIVLFTSEIERLQNQHQAEENRANALDEKVKKNL